ncbi:MULTISPECIES: NPP1 family protein [Delftia]|uniref:NPP1 family protein n=2 Tax=Delftia TaxID=80865 RepID=A0A7T2S5T3_DELAC|nr:MULTISPECIES: NPP1 family protein [Delftia]QPS09407.1 NPP1 family protein [Delftia acidovorans]
MRKSNILLVSLTAILSSTAHSWEKDDCPSTEAACFAVSKENRPQISPNLKSGKIVFAFGSNGDGCLASSPVGEIAGELKPNPGIKDTGARNGHCAYANQLEKATVAVSEFKTNVDGDEYSARMFSVYFVKDQGPTTGWGHRHDWEDVVIWSKNGNIEYIGASQHGPIHNYKSQDVPHLKGQPNVYAFKYVIHKGTHNFSKAQGKNSSGEFIPTNTNPTPSGKWFGEAEDIYLDFSDFSEKSSNYWSVIKNADFGKATFKAGNSSYINKNIPAGWPKSLIFKAK